jgi:uncharacterized protein with HEPN domain
MSFEPRDYLRHILGEADYIIQESGRLTFEKFIANGTLQRAFVRTLEVIGEALKAGHAAHRACLGALTDGYHALLDTTDTNRWGLPSRTGV